jgi:hypothetical protein
MEATIRFSDDDEDRIANRIAATVIKLLDARERRQVKPPPPGVPGPRECQAHVIFALEQMGRDDQKVQDVAERIVANGYVHIGRYDPLEQIKANICAMRATRKDIFTYPARAHVAWSRRG